MSETTYTLYGEFPPMVYAHMTAEQLESKLRHHRVRPEYVWPDLDRGLFIILGDVRYWLQKDRNYD